MRIMPHLNHLRSFEAAARHLSFTTAAGELNCTQSAVSGHVRSLEDFIGRPLFQRFPRSLTLTSLGEAYLPAVRQALTQVDAATEAILSPRRDRRVVVSCPVSLATNWLPGVLARFGAAHPEVDVTVEERIWRDAGPEMADVRVAVLHEDEVTAAAVPIWRERLLVLRGAGSSSEAGHAPLIHNLGRPDHWGAISRAWGVPLDTSGGVRTSSLNAAMEHAMAGGGLAVVPEVIAGAYLRRGLVEAVGVPVVSGWVVTLSDESLLGTRDARALWSWLREEGERVDAAHR